MLFYEDLWDSRKKDTEEKRSILRAPGPQARVGVVDLGSWSHAGDAQARRDSVNSSLAADLLLPFAPRCLPLPSQLVWLNVSDTLGIAAKGVNLHC